MQLYNYRLTLIFEIFIKKSFTIIILELIFWENYHTFSLILYIVIY